MPSMRRTLVPLLTIALVVIVAVAFTTGSALAHEGHEGTPETGFNYLWLMPSAIAATASGYVVFRFSHCGRNPGRYPASPRV